MLSWQELSQHLQQIIKAIIRFVKARKREEATIGLAALLFWLGFSLPKFFPPEAELSKFVNSWHGVLVAQCVFYITGAGLLLYGGYRIWQLVLTPHLPPPKDRPSAIKGPIAFAPADGELFRRLGREEELRKLLGFIEDDQVRLIVLMGASGVGKTSLLRAGLTDILKNKDIDYHYWEAVPTASGQGLLRSIQESWQPGPTREVSGVEQSMSAAIPASLEDLVNPAPAFGERRHVIVLDQFEQLHSSGINNPVLRLLRKVAREAKPPHRVTWIVAFRREFRAEWEDFTIPEKERRIYPAEISLRLFTAEQARDVISQLIDEAHLSIHQGVIDSLVEAATVDGEVSPVDIGIGLLVLAELHDRQGGQTLTLDNYQFVGGAEGLLTHYINRCIDIFPEEEWKTILKAMLALRQSENDQRIAEGRTCTELALETNADASRLHMQLERLAQRDMRLLEIVVPFDGSDIRYRLPHERLIPALRRISGQLLADVDQAKLKFENAFTAWKNGERGSQYLLKTKDLRSVERYKHQIPWAKDIAEKQIFLHRSQRRRTLRQITTIVLIISLIASGWFASAQYQHYEAKRYLQDNNYPPELYDWQNQLKTLELREGFNVKRFPWLQSSNLEEFTIKVTKSTNSLEGLGDSLTRCPKLKKLTLYINTSQVSSLEPLSKLTNLTHLEVHFLGSQVSSLEPLSELTNLTHLILHIGGNGNEVINLEPLAKLTNLTYLTIEFASGGENEAETFADEINRARSYTFQFSRNYAINLEPLSKLVNLTELSLDLSGSQGGGLEPLSKLVKLTKLNLNLDESQVSSLEPLSNLANIRELNLLLLKSQVSSLEPLSKLHSLTKLKLLIRDNEVVNLEPLTKLTGMAQLEIDIDDGQVSGLEPLSKLTNLTQFNLTLDHSDLRNLESLSKLTNLNELNIDINVTVKNLEPLSKLINIPQLNLMLSYSQISSLEPLSKLTNLAKLKLETGLSKVNSLDPLSKLTNLTHLELDIVESQVSSLEPLLKLNALAQFSLDIDSDKVRILEPLSNLNKRTQFVLNLRGNDGTSLEPLSNLSNLIKLTLNPGRGINSLEPLSNLSNLTELNLDLSGSQGGSLEPLSKLVKLTKLNLTLGNGQVSSLVPLSKLTNLSELHLDSRGNVDNLEPLTNIPNLTKLYLNLIGSQGSSLEPLLKLNCPTIEFALTTEQRLTLKAIHKSVINLTF